MKPEGCIFCGSTADVSGEHLWDDWISRLYEKQGHKREYRFTEYNANNEIIRRFLKTSIDTTARVVCEKCNNGWMSRITERSAKVLTPMVLSTTALRLSPADMQALVSLVFLKAAVVDCMRRERPPLLTQAERTVFWTSRSFPLGLQVWLSAYAGPSPKGSLWTTHNRFQPTSLDGLVFSNFTYLVGHALFQLNYQRWTKVIARKAGKLYRLRPAMAWERSTFEIWPRPLSERGWPRDEILTRAHLKPFRHRIDNIESDPRMLQE